MLPKKRGRKRKCDSELNSESNTSIRFTKNNTIINEDNNNTNVFNFGGMKILINESETTTTTITTPIEDNQSDNNHESSIIDLCEIDIPTDDRIIVNQKRKSRRY